MEMESIERGWTVFSEDNKRIGDVVEVHPHYLLVSRGVLVVRDVYVPRYAVASVEDRTVRLAITDERLRKMGWTSPPPVPPPTDGPAPHLVPPVDTEDYGPPPLLFRDDAGSVASDTETASGMDPDFFAPYQPEMEDFDDYVDMGVQYGATIEVDGDTQLAVRRVGEGPPVVFVHGWGLDHRVWDYLTLDLPREYTVVTYDGRGYGASSAPWEQYGLESLSRDLRVLLRTLDLCEATVVGLDLGAAAALHYVLSGGRRATRLVLIAPTIPAGGADAATLSGPMAALPEPWRAMCDDLRADRPRLAARLAQSWAPTASPETQAWLCDMLLAATPHALLQGLAALAHAEWLGPLQDMSLPVRVLLVRDDPLVALEPTQSALSAIPNVEIVRLDTAGHLPMIADPARIAAEIRAAFAQGNGAATVVHEPFLQTPESLASTDDAEVAPDDAGANNMEVAPRDALAGVTETPQETV